MTLLREPGAAHDMQRPAIAASAPLACRDRRPPPETRRQWRAQLLRCVALVLSIAIPGVADETDRSPSAPKTTGSNLPSIRRVFVPAAAPNQWPAVDWEPLPLAEFERKLAVARRTAPESSILGLQRAEYQATLVGNTLEQGQLEWTPWPAARTRFLSLEPLNLALSNLKWIGADPGPVQQPVVWGTTPEQTTGILLDRAGARIVGNFALRGSQLARSVEFQLRLPAAAASRLTLRAPDGLVLSTTAGELSRPRPAPEAGWSLWEVLLGGRSACRLRVSPPAALDVRRPLVEVRSRTNYSVRTEVVRVLAEFELTANEATVRDLRFLVDEGLQITSVEFGDDADVPWISLDPAEGRGILVRLPDPLSGSGPLVRVRGIATVKPQESWKLPRVRPADAIESEAQVTVRLQPPTQAADLRLDGYRQVELIAHPTEGETFVFRQLRADATLVVIPADARLVASCRSVALARLVGDEWTLTGDLSLRASAGSAFEMNCRIPPGWEITDVGTDKRSGESDLGNWSIGTGPEGKQSLRLEFLNALSPAFPQTVRISARCPSLARGQTMSAPILSCTGCSDIEAVTVVVTDPQLVPTLHSPVSVETLYLADLPEPTQANNALLGLSADERSTALVIRTSSSDPAGSLELRSARAPTPPGSIEAANAPAKSQPQPKGGPVVAASVGAVVRINAFDTGFDVYSIAATLTGPAGAPLSWILPPEAEFLGARLNGRAVEPQFAEGRHRVQLSTAPGEFDDAQNLEFEYRKSGGGTTTSRQRVLALPVFENPALDFHLTLLVPANLQPGEFSTGTDLIPDRSPPRRWLGPLSRPEAESVFHPLRGTDWQRLWRKLTRHSGNHPERELASEADLLPQSATSSARLFSPELTLHAWRGSRLMVPAEVRLFVWNRDELQSLAWVAGWVALLATVTLRIAAPPGMRLLATAAMALLAGGVLAASFPYVEFCGSGLAGMILGILLPARLLRIDRVTNRRNASSLPSGSTRSFAPAAAIGLLAALHVTFAAFAQDQSSVREDSLKSDRVDFADRVDVLVPVGSDGRPAGEVPLCYVPADFLAALEARQPETALPESLIARARYDAVVTGNRQARISARFDVHVLGARDAVRVALPLTNVVLGDSEACLVDGQPCPVLLGSGGRGLIVELPGRMERPARVPEPTDESATDRAETGDRPAASSRMHRVELRLHSLVEPESNETMRARLGIARVCDTTATLVATAQPPPFLSVTATGVGGAADESAGENSPRTVTVNPGPATELQFRWSSSQQGLISPAAELSAAVSGVVDVMPSLARTNFQVAYRLLSGSVDSLLWTLPRDCAVQSIQAPGLSGYVIEPGPDGTRRLFLEFATRPTGNFIVMAAFVQPLTADRGQRDLPLVDFDGALERAHLTLGPYQLAFRPPVDFKLAVGSGASGPVVKPRTVDEFLKVHPHVGARPQLAVETISSGVIRLSLRDFDTVLTAKTQSQGRFFRDRLDWTFRADIDQPVVPPFQYRLRVDRRLLIRNVSVLEDGAERLLRWSRLSDSVVLFLNDRAARPQTLRIDASLPITAPQVVDLPRLLLEGVNTGPEQIVLGRESELRVTPSREPSPDVAGPVAAPLGKDPAEADSTPLRWELSPESPPPQVRVELAPSTIAAETAVIVKRQGAIYEVAAALSYRVEAGKVSRFDVQLPEDLAQIAAIKTVPASRILTEPTVDGRAGLAFVSERSVSDQFQAVLKTTLQPSSQSDWVPPVLTVKGSQPAARFLIVPAEVSVPLPPTDLPDWVKPLLAGDLATSRVVCYRLPSDGPPPVLRLNEQRNAEPPRSLADVEIEFDPTGVLTGRALLWLPDAPPDQLVFDWPTGAVPVAAFIDHQPQSLAAPTDGQWTLPLPNAPPPRLVWFYWSDRSRALPNFAGPLEGDLPGPRNVFVTTEALTTRFSSNFATGLTLTGLNVTGLKSGDQDEQALRLALARWQAAVAALEHRSPDTPLPESLILPYLRRSARIAHRLAERAESAMPIELGRQFAELDRRTAALQLPIADDDLPTSSHLTLPLVVGPIDLEHNRIRLLDRSAASGTAGPIVSEQIWVVRQMGLRLLLGSLAALVVSLLAWKTAPFWRWVQQREPLAWGALGLFWWLWLQPSELGLVLIGLAAVRSFQIVRGKSAKSPAAPSTT